MNRQLPKINTSQMADLSFLLLTFFMMTSSINSDQGLSRRLTPPSDVKTVVAIDKNNIMLLRIDYKNELSVENNAMNSVIPIDHLKEIAKDFLSNSRKEVVFIDYIGEYPVPKGVISLTTDQSATYNMYVQVQNELQRAVNELRDQVSMNYFGKMYKQLDATLQRAVQKAVPANISETSSNNYAQKS